jgi:hypothetical protein
MIWKYFHIIKSSATGGTSEEETAMKMTFVRWLAAPMVGLLVFSALLGTSRQSIAAGQVTTRPILDFVNAQGTFDLGFLIVPPVPNFLGTSDPVAGLSMSIDYAGLADETCGGVAGTTFAGSVKEKLLPDGRAEVTVELLTSDAIAWVVDGFDFANDPVIFGVRWEDKEGNCVINGTPVLGNSMLKLTLINTAPGAPLPDLIQLAVAPEPGQELLAISLHAEAIGELADGTLARAETHQVAKVKDGELRFTVENVLVEPLP